MKTILKSLALTFIFLITQQLVIAQEADKIVTLTVTGTGKSLDEARTNALRSAIEQAFGTFISSKTEILNDNLIKDEIVSVANGNIQKFDIISEVQIPEGGYAASLKATVSVSKLTSFVESKGVVVEFKGGVFAANILIQELYEKNEITAIRNFLKPLDEIAKKSFDYAIKADDPYSANNKWIIPITVNVFLNKNFENIPILLDKTLRSLSLSEAELENYRKLKKDYYPVSLATLNSTGVYYLRKNESRIQILDFIYSLKNAINNFEISNGLAKKTLNDYNIKSSKQHPYRGNLNNIIINDDNFRVIAEQYNGNIRGKSLFNKSKDPYAYNLPPLNYAKGNEEIENIFCDGSHGYGISPRVHSFSDSFKVFSKIMYKSANSTNYGLVISFFNINPSKSSIEFKFEEIKTLDEIKQITKYEIIKK